MRIYFCGSIRGGRHDIVLYQRIVHKLQSYGQVLTEHVSRSDISEMGENAGVQGDKGIHDRDVQWLTTSDVLSAMIRGADDGSPNSCFQVRDYQEDQVERVLDDFFSDSCSKT